MQWLHERSSAQSVVQGLEAVVGGDLNASVDVSVAGEVEADGVGVCDRRHGERQRRRRRNHEDEEEEERNGGRHSCVRKLGGVAVSVKKRCGGVWEKCKPKHTPSTKSWVVTFKSPIFVIDPPWEMPHCFEKFITPIPVLNQIFI